MSAPLPAWAANDDAKALLFDIFLQRPEQSYQSEFEAPRYPGKAARALDRLYLDWFMTVNMRWHDDDIRKVETPFALIKRMLADGVSLTAFDVVPNGEGGFSAREAA